MPITLKVRVRDKWHTVEIQEAAGGPPRVLVDGESVDIDIEGLTELAATLRPRAPVLPVSHEQRVEVLSAPLPGIIISVSVSLGDQVSRGDEICILEAMKMHQSLRSEWTGTIRAIHVIQGQHIGGREAIAEILVT